MKLYEANTGAVTSMPGLSLIPKLKFEHIRLTNFSKMRVDLAAQVCNCSGKFSYLLSFQYRYLVKQFPKLYFLHMVRKPLKLLILLGRLINFLIHLMFHHLAKDNERGRYFSNLSEVPMIFD